MSKKQSNRQRAAYACNQATGVDYNRCLDWARVGGISRHQPVPDARTPAQRRFEALLAHTLTEPLRDSQLDGAVLGLQGVEPDGEQPTLDLHPVMANRIVAELLPRFDAPFGGIRGVPGLRLERAGGGWLLVDLSSSAAVSLRHEDADWQPPLPGRERGLTAIWRDAPTRLSDIERRDLAEWDEGRSGWPRPDARDLLFSRVLRRPLLVNAAGSSHGWVNTYNHYTYDIVFEWCCGVPAVDVAAELRDSGMTAPADGVDVRPSSDMEPHPERIDMGDASIVLRCLDARWCQKGAEKIATGIRRRYQ
ncbi:hypothetical protein [Streptomyces sp. NBC_00986]|uniref:hypothetical protein n=1 Tax=Streptomyces sp. NBC_00986 TaxID=2903702 RepID=UPI00386B730D|nr:hypothetical protein OG504_17160 [Streptomyces sp. NBC_00986]